MMKFIYDKLRSLGAEDYIAKQLIRLLGSSLADKDDVFLAQTIADYRINFKLGSYVMSKVQPDKQRNTGNVRTFDRFDLVSQSYLNAVRKTGKLQDATDYEWLKLILSKVHLFQPTVISAIAFQISSKEAKAIVNGTIAKVIKDTAIQADRPHAPMYRSQYDLEQLGEFAKTIGLSLVNENSFTVSDLEYLLLKAFAEVGVNSMIEEIMS